MSRKSKVKFVVKNPLYKNPEGVIGLRGGYVQDVRNRGVEMLYTASLLKCKHTNKLKRYRPWDRERGGGVNIRVSLHVFITSHL